MSHWGYRAWTGDKHRLPSMDYPYAYQGSRSARHYGLSPRADDWFDDGSMAPQDGKRVKQLFHVSNFPPLFVNANQQNTERSNDRGQRRHAQYYGNRNMQLSDPNFLPASPYGANRPVSAVRQNECCAPARRANNPNSNQSGCCPPRPRNNYNNQSDCCVPPARNTYNPNYGGLQNVPSSRPLARNACDCSNNPPPLDFNRPVIERETYIEPRSPAFMAPPRPPVGSDSVMRQELYDRAMNQQNYELAFGNYPRNNYASPRFMPRLDDYYAY